MLEPLPPALPSLSYECPRAERAIRIDGRLDDDAWADVAWTDLFVDIEGDLKPRPRHETRVKMAWDDDYFYFGAQMEEPHVWATLTQRDSVIFHDNDFEVFLNPSKDTKNYYEFEINALGTEWDLLLRVPYREGGKGINAFEFEGLKTAVNVRGTLNDPSDTDEGWDVEIAIPWEAFDEHTENPGAPELGDTWKVNFSRVEWDTTIEDGKYVKVPDRREHNWVWSPMGLIDMHLPQRWGVVEFVEKQTETETDKPADRNEAGGGSPAGIGADE